MFLINQTSKALLKCYNWVLKKCIIFADREDSNQASTSSRKYNSIDLVELQVHCNNKIHEIKMSGSATVSKYKYCLVNFKSV